MADVDEGAPQDPERLGWSALDSHGRRAYFRDFLDDPTIPSDPVEDEQASDPVRFNRPVAVELEGASERQNVG